MIRSAGSAAAAIPQIAGELDAHGQRGRARPTYQRITGSRLRVEFGGAVQAMRPLLQVLEQMPPGVERNAQAVQIVRRRDGHADCAVAQSRHLHQRHHRKELKAWRKARPTPATGSCRLSTRRKARLTGFDQLWGAIATSGAAALGKINSGMDTLIGKLQRSDQVDGAIVSGRRRRRHRRRRALRTAASSAAAAAAPPIQIWPGCRAASTSCRRHAVRQPGVMAFLEALRRSGGDLRGVLDRMGTSRLVAGRAPLCRRSA